MDTRLLIFLAGIVITLGLYVVWSDYRIGELNKTVAKQETTITLLEESQKKLVDSVNHVAQAQQAADAKLTDARTERQRADTKIRDVRAKASIDPKATEKAIAIDDSKFWRDLETLSR